MNAVAAARNNGGLRARCYNAVVVGARDVHSQLRILRVRPDWGRLRLIAGQYTVLGLGEWEPSLPERSTMEGTGNQIICRAYSVCCSMLDPTGKMVRAGKCDYLEFYIALVPGNGGSRPKLSPRLFCLREGQRLYVGPRAHGRYTLAGTTADDQIVFVSTGTGEAPHNAMLMELLASGHRQPIVALTSVRYRQDLAYLSVHRELERRFGNYRYLPLTTREPENVDPQSSGYVGRRHLQEFVGSGDFERAGGLSLDPDRTHVYLCGNPAMVGLGRHGVSDTVVEPTGMLEIFQRRGFRLDNANLPGNLHCERY